VVHAGVASAVLASLLAAVPGACEDAPLIKPGARVRVVVIHAVGHSGLVDAKVITGRFVALGDSVLTVETPAAAPPVVIPRQDVESLSVSVNGNKRGIGAAVGLGAGVAAGILIGQTAGDDTNCFICMTAEGKSTLAVLFLAPLGALIGVVAAPDEVWLSVPLERVRIAFDPGTATPAVAITVRF